MRSFNVAYVYIFLFLILPPLILTVLNLIQLFRSGKKQEQQKEACPASTWITELVGILLGGVYFYAGLSITDISFVMWNVQISEINKYPPFDVSRSYQLILVCVLALLGWGFLRFCPLRKQPPLASVLSFSALYAFLIGFVVFMIQLWGIDVWGFLLIYPVNLLVILAKLIRDRIVYQKSQPVKEEWQGIRRLLSRSASLPVLGFLLLAAVLGILLLALILFGQSPGEMVKLWTNTAEWTFSRQTPPPKVPYDGHYLCTVAANGHRRLVRPLRTGKRGGHLILVNRQLMIANAFEDLIRERTPHFHRALRNFYDKTGFPISRHISTRLRSDIVYLVMKPLEWFFLLVLYLFDAKPEERIAVQYSESKV